MKRKILEFTAGNSYCWLGKTWWQGKDHARKTMASFEQFGRL